MMIRMIRHTIANRGIPLMDSIVEDYIVWIVIVYSLPVHLLARTPLGMAGVYVRNV